MSEILHEVCLKHGISITEARSERRDQRCAVARQEFWYRCRREIGASYAVMARFVGRGDHTTSRSGAKKFERRLAHMKEANG